MCSNFTVFSHTYLNKWKISKNIDIKPNIPMITLNVNRVNIPIKRQKFSDWIKIEILIICSLKRSILNIRTKKYWDKSIGKKRNTNQMKIVADIQMSVKLDVRQGVLLHLKRVIS